MENSMGPPLPPGYSLRVKLFGGHAHREGDRPLRCFRVVSSPDSTVQEFCNEASRIHSINYGESIEIKKVQDDEEFDITQNELLGNVFRNLDTIRIIQAVSHPGIRDSLPPTSALRFTYGAGRKRVREESVQLDGSAPLSTINSNKKQKLSDLDPDLPLPSREIATNGSRLSVIHDSQESDDGEGNNGAQDDTRHVRNPLPRIIPGTPSPQRILSRKSTSKNGSADDRGSQSVARSPSNPPRAKSASYHVSRPSELADATEQIQGQPILPSIFGDVTKSVNENNVADDVTSEDEGSTISKTKTALLKKKSSTLNGLPASNRARKFSTPPSATQQRPGSRGSVTTPNELPLTPTSKQREERALRNNGDSTDPRTAAKEAAEKRQREADEARRAEEARIAKEEQEKQEELDRATEQAEVERKAAAIEATRLKRAEDGRKKKESKEKAAKAEAEAKQEKADEAERLKKVQEDASKAQLPSSSPAPARTPVSTPILPPKRALGSRGQSGTPLIPLRRSSLKNVVSSSAIMSSSPSSSKSPERTVKGVGIETQMPLPKTNRRVSFQENEEPPAILPPAKTLSTTKIPPPAKAITSIPAGITPRKSAIKKATEQPVINTPTPAAVDAKPKVTSAVPPPSKRYSLNGNTTPASVSKATPVAKSKLRNVVPAKATPAKETPKSTSPTAQTTPVPAPVPRSRKSETPILPSPASSQTKKKKTPIHPTVPPSSAQTSKIEPLVRPILPPAASQTSKMEPPVRSILPPAASQSKKIGTPVRSIVPPAASQSKKTETPVRSIVPPVSTQSKRTETPVRPPSKGRSLAAVVRSYTKSETEKSKSKSASAEPVNSKVSPPTTVDSAETNKAAGGNSSTASEPKVDRVSPTTEQQEITNTTSEQLDNAEDVAEKMDVDEDETQSHHTSSREGSPSNEQSGSRERTPIIFNESAKEEVRKNIKTTVSDASEDESEDEDEEMLDAVQSSKPVNTRTQSPTKKRSKADQPSKYSSESESEEEEVAKGRIPESSPPVLAVRTPETKAIDAKLKSSKEFSRIERSNTQDQVDHQLTSSMYEVRSSMSKPNTPTPVSTSSTNGRPPTIKFGSSLRDIHQKRPLGASSQAKTSVGRIGVKPFQPDNEDEDESSDDASDAGSSSGSDEDIPAVAAPKATQSVVPGSWAASSLPGKSKKAKPKSETSDDDSDSKSENSDSDISDNDDEETQRTKAGRELAAQVAAMQSSQLSDNGMPSPKKFNPGTQGTPRSKSKLQKTYSNKRRPADRYIQGQSFSQVR